MTDILFAWLTKPKIQLTMLEEIIGIIEIMTLIGLTYLIVLLIENRKQK